MATGNHLVLQLKKNSFIISLWFVAVRSGNDIGQFWASPAGVETEVQGGKPVCERIEEERRVGLK